MLLSDEQSLIRDTARDFARAEIAPHAADWEREAKIPGAVLTKLGELGFLGMCVPERYGGAEVDAVSYVLALMEIAGADGATSTVMSVNNSPICAALMGYGSEAQKNEILPPLARGEEIGAFLLTEPQAGSEASNLLCRATRDGDDYLIDGTKQFITSARIASMAMIFAVTDSEAGKRGISCFLARTDAPGYVVHRDEEKLGQRASDTCQVVLDGLRAPASAMLGAPGQGYRIALANLSIGRIGIAAQAVGMAQAALDAATAYAKERVTFGKAIIEHQAIAFRLADMATQVEVARQSVLHAAALKDAGEPCLKEASMAKLFASEMAERVCSDAIQIHGGYGYLRDYPVERIYRDVRVCQIYEGTSDVQRMLISREVAAGR